MSSNASNTKFVSVEGASELDLIRSLHTVTAPAVRVKIKLSYRHNTVVVFFFAENKNIGNVKVALASSNT